MNPSMFLEQQGINNKSYRFNCSGKCLSRDNATTSLFSLH